MAVRPDWKFITRRPAHFLAFGFGTGLSRKAPGTVGTLAAFPLYWALSGLPPAAFLAVVAALFLLGIRWCGVTGEALGVEDFGGIVWDEIVAFLLVLAFVPQTVFGFAAGFALFRLFDIWKPFPIRQFDAKVGGGFGVMLDDLLAAGYAVAAMKLLEKIANGG